MVTVPANSHIDHEIEKIFLASDAEFQALMTERPSQRDDFQIYLDAAKANLQTVTTDRFDDVQDERDYLRSQIMSEDDPFPDSELD